MKKMMALAATPLFALGGRSGQAQDWPSHPVRILVGSAPGDGTDALARAAADRLDPLLKQAVVVENRPGASNTLAVGPALPSRPVVIRKNNIRLE